MAFPFHFLSKYTYEADKTKRCCSNERHDLYVIVHTHNENEEGEVCRVSFSSLWFGCVVAISNNLCRNKEENDDGNNNWSEERCKQQRDRKQESAKANKINKHFGFFFFCSNSDTLLYDTKMRMCLQHLTVVDHHRGASVDAVFRVCICARFCTDTHTHIYINKIRAICYFILLLLLAVSAINFLYSFWLFFSFANYREHRAKEKKEI